MGYTISITNQKGGVAKTTTAIHLSVGLARENFKTLLIDLDPQRNATGVVLKTSDFKSDDTIFGAFQKKKICGEMIHETEITNLFMIPSSIHLVELENMLSGAVDGFFRLSESLQEILREFDFIIIDCPPSLSILTINALVAATHIIIPLQVSKFSIDGINNLLDVIATVQKRYNARLGILGGLFQFYDERTTIAKTMYDAIAKIIPVFNSTIPKSIIVEEAHMLKSDLYQYAPKNKVTRSYVDFIREVRYALEG